ncbi:Succinate dehydrogenase cytochrome B subunit, mitochondrial [Tolypocladium capitatum]|uniref:Succinate dehydrogenase cytochrome B subunit, mitochondrial n=1 Tax=Tolypocladium capitatum TaxID=45235 RepID=A0A2K3QAV9_9HYPO|nr:Succinate dehydrogenase cytochrome B subunit, mitochondrial [Tolypocladium capitatum]
MTATMIARRVGAAALRKGTSARTLLTGGCAMRSRATKPSIFYYQNMVRKLALASNISTSQARHIATIKLSNDEATRSSSSTNASGAPFPHLGIY